MLLLRREKFELKIPLPLNYANCVRRSKKNEWGDAKNLSRHSILKKDLTLLKRSYQSASQKKCINLRNREWDILILAHS
jgi:hypothetical protein